MDAVLCWLSVIVHRSSVGRRRSSFVGCRFSFVPPRPSSLLLAGRRSWMSGRRSLSACRSSCVVGRRSPVCLSRSPTSSPKARTVATWGLRLWIWARTGPIGMVRRAGSRSPGPPRPRKSAISGCLAEMIEQSGIKKMREFRRVRSRLCSRRHGRSGLTSRSFRCRFRVDLGSIRCESRVDSGSTRVCSSAHAVAIRGASEVNLG